MKCAHLKYYVNTMSTSREILFLTPLAYKPNLENLTFTSNVNFENHIGRAHAIDTCARDRGVCIKLIMLRFGNGMYRYVR